MKKIALIVRILLGLMMVVFGLNKFLHFMPMPEMSPSMGAFMGALMDTGYLMMVVAFLEIAGGVLLLINKKIAIALLLLFPVMINAFLAHLFLDPAGIGGSLIAVVMIIFLFFNNKKSFDPILKG